MALKLLPDIKEMKNYDDILKISASLLEDIKEILKKAVKKSSALTNEQFITEVMIGRCPQCGSNQTKNCKNVKGIEDFTVGLCIKCGHLWCSECGNPLAHNIHCNHWDICIKCNEVNEMGFCVIDLMECKKLKDIPTPTI